MKVDVTGKEIFMCSPMTEYLMLAILILFDLKDNDVSFFLPF